MIFCVRMLLIYLTSPLGNGIYVYVCLYRIVLKICKEYMHWYMCALEILAHLDFFNMLNS